MTGSLRTMLGGFLMGGGWMLAVACATAPVGSVKQQDAEASQGGGPGTGSAGTHSDVRTDVRSGTPSGTHSGVTWSDSGTPPRDAAAFYDTPYSERWYGRAVMYEVMVRSFADSNGDGIGDLKGLISRLDYLNTGDPSSTTDLKVDALWLMPIFKSPSYHGYDATDYMSIDPVYGTLEDFRTLVAEAHRRGIRILLDLVLNHTSNQHPWFQRAARSEDPQERDWYVWGSGNPGWQRPWGGGPVWHSRGPRWYYGLFWEGMPDLNFTHPPVREAMEGIAEHWLREGADGYRLDAIRYLYENGDGKQADQPESHVWLTSLAARLRKIRPDVALVGEVWINNQIVATYYGKTLGKGGDSLDLCFNFDEAGGLVSSLNDGHPTELVMALKSTQEAFVEPRFSAPFLTNHDMPRLASILEHHPGKLKLAPAVLLSLPGTPFLYQGEEIGLFNGSRRGDEGKRTPMQWDASPQAGFTAASQPWNPLSGRQEQVSVGVQQGVDGSLLRWYQALIRQRKASPALTAGRIFAPSRGEGAQAPILSFQRAVPGELMLMAFNFGSQASPEAAGITLSPEALQEAGLAGVPVEALGLDALSLGGGGVWGQASSGGVRVQLNPLPAHGAAWIRIYKK